MKEIALGVVLALYLVSFLYLMCLIKIGAMDAPNCQRKETDLPEQMEEASPLCCGEASPSSVRRRQFDKVGMV